MTAEINFVRQQGFKDAVPETCACQYPALMFQPRVIGILVLVGLFFQAWPYFLALSAILWWNVIVPSLNPFDTLYNYFIAKPKGLTLLEPAPPPRRFSQGMAGTFMLAISLTLLYDMHTFVWVLEGILLVALGALIFGRFCLGSYIFLLITGQTKFANRTLPWSGTG